MILNKLLTDQREVIDKITASISVQQSFFLTYLNQHCFNIYNTDTAYKELLNIKFTVYQADEGIYLALKYLFGKKIEEIRCHSDESINTGMKLVKKKIPLAIVGGNFDKKFVQEWCHQEKNKSGWLSEWIFCRRSNRKYY